jgi:hypothetical protein
MVDPHNHEINDVCDGSCHSTLIRTRGVIQVLSFAVENQSVQKQPSSQCVCFNSIMLGRLRSKDYVSWMQCFLGVFGRWPFATESKQDFASDIQVFIETYGVANLARVSDTTLEMAKFEKKH